MELAGAPAWSEPWGWVGTGGHGQHLPDPRHFESHPQPPWWGSGSGQKLWAGAMSAEASWTGGESCEAGMAVLHFGNGRKAGACCWLEGKPRHRHTPQESSEQPGPLDCHPIHPMGVQEDHCEQGGRALWPRPSKELLSGQSGWWPVAASRRSQGPSLGSAALPPGPTMLGKFHHGCARQTPQIKDGLLASL